MRRTSYVAPASVQASRQAEHRAGSIACTSARELVRGGRYRVYDKKLFITGAERIGQAHRVPGKPGRPGCRMRAPAPASPFPCYPWLITVPPSSGLPHRPAPQVCQDCRKTSLCLARRLLAILANPVATGPNLFDQFDLQCPPSGMILDRDPKPWFESCHEPTKILPRE